MLQILRPADPPHVALRLVGNHQYKQEERSTHILSHYHIRNSAYQLELSGAALAFAP